MDNFLENRHHNVYNKYPHNYKIYICKDCTESKKEYVNYTHNEIPKNILNFGYMEILSGQYPIVITTPLMVCPFGFNKESNSMTLQFTNVKKDPEMNSFYNFIQEFEMKLMDKLGLSEDDSDLFLSQIRYDKNGKYDPNLLIKVPFIKNSYNVDIRTKDSPCSITNIYKFSKLQCDIYVDKLWKYNDKYICKWKVKNILIN